MNLDLETATLPAGLPRSSAPIGGVARDEVELWRVALDDLDEASVERCESFLSADERDRTQRFFFARDRRRAIAGRGVLRQLLSHYTGRAPRALRFRYGPAGKPALVSARGQADIFFNVTHAEGLALFAFTGSGEVGVDAEKIRDVPDWEPIAATCLASREVARIHSAPAERRAEEFFRAWTRHEALLKAQGVGLAGNVSGVDLRCDPALADGWHDYPIHAAAGFLGALAVSATARWVTCRNWSDVETRPAGRFSGRQRRTPLDPTSRTEILFP